MSKRINVTIFLVMSVLWFLWTLCMFHDFVLPTNAMWGIMILISSASVGMLYLRLYQFYSQLAVSDTAARLALLMVASASALVYTVYSAVNGHYIHAIISAACFGITMQAMVSGEHEYKGVQL